MREGEGCLPTTDTFKRVFGTMGGGRKGTDKLILSGEYPNSLVSTQYDQQILDKGRKNEIDTVTPAVPIISVKKFKNILDKTREATSSSPLGIHVGHYK